MGVGVYLRGSRVRFENCVVVDHAVRSDVVRMGGGRCVVGGIYSVSAGSDAHDGEAGVAVGSGHGFPLRSVHSPVCRTR